MLRYYLEVRFRSGPEEWFKKKKKPSSIRQKKNRQSFQRFFSLFLSFQWLGGGGIDPYQEKKINKGKNKEKG